MAVASQAIVPKRVYTKDTPLLLQPLSWCGRRYKNLTHIEPTGQCGKICQIIKKIMPAILLALAIVLAAIVGLGDYCVSPDSQFSDLKLTDKNVGEEEKNEIKKRILQLIVSSKPQPYPHKCSMSRGEDDNGTPFTNYDYKATVSRPCLYRLIKAFKGPVPAEANLRDITDFILGNEMESNLKHQTERFITNTLSSISIDFWEGPCDFSKSRLL